MIDRYHLILVQKAQITETSIEYNESKKAMLVTPEKTTIALAFSSNNRNDIIKAAMSLQSLNGTVKMRILDIQTDQESDAVTLL